VRCRRAIDPAIAVPVCSCLERFPGRACEYSRRLGDGAGFRSRGVEGRGSRQHQDRGSSERPDSQRLQEDSVKETSAGFAAVLLEAMQLEREGHAFYLAAAHQTEDVAGRDMFLTLARDELNHLAILDEAYRSWTADGVCPSPEELGLEPARRPARRLPVFPPPEKVAQVIAPRTNELEALRKGIESEEASIALYQRGLDMSEHSAEQQLYRFLIGEEEGHRTILQGEYDHLTHSGFWFDIREFNLEAMG
jgi:rubrerythrin